MNADNTDTRIIRETYDDIEIGDLIEWGGGTYTVLDKGKHVSGYDGSHLKITATGNTSELGGNLIRENLIRDWISERPDDFVVSGTEVSA